MSLLCGEVGWSLVCEYGICWSYSLCVFSLSNCDLTLDYRLYIHFIIILISIARHIPDATTDSFPCADPEGGGGGTGSPDSPPPRKSQSFSRYSYKKSK